MSFLSLVCFNFSKSPFLGVRAGRFTVPSVNFADDRSSKFVCWIAVCWHEIHTKCVAPSRDEEHDWNYHREGSAVSRIRHGGQDGRHSSAARDSSYNQSRTSFGVPSEAADAESHDRGEAHGFEEQGEHQHCQARVLPLRDGRAIEHHNHGEVEEENPSWLDEFHQERPAEPADGETALCSSEQLGSQRAIGVLPRLNNIIDKVACNRNLRTGIAPLRCGGMEEAVLLPKRFVARSHMRFLCLERHVCVGDFGDVGNKEYASQEEDEDRYGEIDPLDIFEGGDRVARRFEEGVAAEDGANHCAYGLDGLGQVYTEFTVFGWTADWNFVNYLVPSSGA
jgi:hypothetical protein